MKQKTVCLALVICLLLGGCSTMFDGSYVSVTPHSAEQSGTQSGAVSAADYAQLRDVLMKLVDSGTESAVINVSLYDRAAIESGMEKAVKHIMERYPIGAYAVGNMDYVIGTVGGQPAVSVDISYIHGRLELRNIQHVADMRQAETLVADALASYSSGVVICVDRYTYRDMQEFVANYAEKNPDIVMELPVVAEGLYPDNGSKRVIELKFTYQNSREVLQKMQTQVQRIFSSAALYVSSDGSEAQKFSQLYTFLMERSDYQQETSITPAYSLLSHGVGDSKAFATVYAAMCRQAGLECLVITGTRAGEAWYWNLIRQDDVYYHVDLLASSAVGQMRRLADADMHGYVWDYSAYPAAAYAESASENTSE